MKGVEALPTVGPGDRIWPPENKLDYRFNEDEAAWKTMFVLTTSLNGFFTNDCNCITCWTAVAKNKWTFESKAAKMRKCLTKFSRILECGAVQMCENLVDLLKSYSNEYLLAKFSVDAAENGPLKVCQNFAES